MCSVPMLRGLWVHTVLRSSRMTSGLILQRRNRVNRQEHRVTNFIQELQRSNSLIRFTLILNCAAAESVRTTVCLRLIRLQPTVQSAVLLRATDANAVRNSAVTCLMQAIKKTRMHLKKKRRDCPICLTGSTNEIGR